MFLLLFQKLELSQEEVHLANSGNVSPTELASQIPEKNGSYSLYRFDHSHEGDYLRLFGKDTRLTSCIEWWFIFNANLMQKQIKHLDQLTPGVLLTGEVVLRLRFIFFFYITFNSQGYIATVSLQWEEPVHTSWSRFCAVNHQASASNYQLSNMKRPGRDSNR